MKVKIENQTKNKLKIVLWVKHKEWPSCGKISKTIVEEEEIEFEDGQEINKIQIR